MQIRIPERQKRWRWAGFVLVLHVVLTAGVSEAQTSRIDALFARLQTSTGEETTQTENDIVDLWSQSGSPMTDSLFLH
ncbi:MAG: hypothetical protein OXC91_12460, partial [Rhodobacteraceae bacterium]|nr:hypothetical protein [Paracoccaceae bacterium]